MKNEAVSGKLTRTSFFGDAVVTAAAVAAAAHHHASFFKERSIKLAGLIKKINRPIYRLKCYLLQPSICLHKFLVGIF